MYGYGTPQQGWGQMPPPQGYPPQPYGQQPYPPQGYPPPGQMQYGQPSGYGYPPQQGQYGYPQPPQPQYQSMPQGQYGYPQQQQPQQQYQSMPPQQQPCWPQPQSSAYGDVLNAYSYQQQQWQNPATAYNAYGFNIPEHFWGQQTAQQQQQQQTATPVAKRANEKQRAIVAQCRGQLWRDPEFPPQAGWRAAREFMPAGPQGGPPRLFYEGIEPNDIQQGELGDCYLLSSLSVLAERPRRIEQLFSAHEDNGCGCYCVTLFKDGERRDVLVDEYFPVNPSGQARYSRNNGPELWVMVIEKAYAKLHGSYPAIESGAEATALTDLTGAPYVTYKIKLGAPAGSDFELFRKLEAHDRADHVMCCNIDGDRSAAAEKSLGLIVKHSYALLRAERVTTQNGAQECLVQLRNPWAKTEWTGAWSDKDCRWTPQLKQQLGVQDRDDGLFWMNIQDFCSHFGNIVVLLVKDGYQCRSIRASLTNKREGFSVCVGGNCTLSLCLFQRNISNMGALRMCLFTEPAYGAKSTAVASTSRVYTIAEELFSSEVQVAAGRYVLLVEAHPDYPMTTVVFGMYGNFNDLQITPMGPLTQGYDFVEIK